MGLRAPTNETPPNLEELADDRESTESPQFANLFHVSIAFWLFPRAFFLALYVVSPRGDLPSFHFGDQLLDKGCHSLLRSELDGVARFLSLQRPLCDQRLLRAECISNSLRPTLALVLPSLLFDRGRSTTLSQFIHL